MRDAILVTGSSGHIGQQLVRELLADSWEVIGLDSKEPSHWPSEAKFSFFPCDLAQTSAIDDVLGMLESTRIASFIHLAGLTGNLQVEGWKGHLAKQTIEVWELALQVNLSSAFQISKFLLGDFSSPEGLIPGDALSIVFCSSIYGSRGADPNLYGEQGLINPACYGVSKAGLEALARYIASVSGPSVRANCVAPGGIFRTQDAEFIRKYSAKVPASRMGLEADVTAAIRFLISGDADYINGQTLTVDGGLTSR